MIKIYTSKGFFALIDEEDFEKISQHRWYFNNGGYATRDTRKGETKHFLMHHEIVGKPPKGFVTHHINGNKLDNRKENLRFVTRQQNQFNRKKERGVSFMGTKWEAYICLNRKKIHLGLHETRQKALEIRKDAERRYYGEYA